MTMVKTSTLVKQYTPLAHGCQKRELCLLHNI